MTLSKFASSFPGKYSGEFISGLNQRTCPGPSSRTSEADAHMLCFLALAASKFPTRETICKTKLTTDLKKAESDRFGLA